MPLLSWAYVFDITPKGWIHDFSFLLGGDHTSPLSWVSVFWLDTQLILIKPLIETLGDTLWSLPSSYVPAWPWTLWKGWCNCSCPWPSTLRTLLSHNWQQGQVKYLLLSCDSGGASESGPECWVDPFILSPTWVLFRFLRTHYWFHKRKKLLAPQLPGWAVVDLESMPWTKITRP